MRGSSYIYDTITHETAVLLHFGQKFLRQINSVFRKKHLCPQKNKTPQPIILSVAGLFNDVFFRYIVSQIYFLTTFFVLPSGDKTMLVPRRALPR